MRTGRLGTMVVAALLAGCGAGCDGGGGKGPEGAADAVDGSGSVLDADAAAGDAGDDGGAADDVPDAETGDADPGDAGSDDADAGDVDAADDVPDPDDGSGAGSDAEVTDPDAGDGDAGDADATDPDAGDADAADGDAGGGPDACLSNACGGCAPLVARPGDPCGDPAIDVLSGVWRCVGADALACVTAQTNACGGPGVLDARPDDPCGVCLGGRVVCDGPDGTRCDAPEAGINACGGCGVLAAEPGAACDACGGAWACDGDGGLACAAAQNLCGGCAALAGVPGTACGPAATWICDGAEAVVCEAGAVGACGGGTPEPIAIGSPCGPCGDGVVRCSGPLSVCAGASALNACGSCGPLPGEAGGACAAGWTWRCVDGELACEEDRLPTGALCVDGGQCDDGWCTALTFDGGPAFCGGLCDLGPEAVDLCPPGQLCTALNPTVPDPACLAACVGDPNPTECVLGCAPPPALRCLPDGLCLDDDGDGEGLALLCGRDCDDTDPAIRPGAAEVCDGIDNDCDGEVDEAAGLTLGCARGEVCQDGRCAPPEVCGNGLDDDGDGAVDCDDAACAVALDCLEDAGVCANALDLGLLYRSVGVEAFSACISVCTEGGPETLGACVAACAAGDGVVTPGCAPCVGAAVECQLETCTAVCAEDPGACFACQQGCSDALLACGGLGAYPVCQTPGEPCTELTQSTAGLTCDPLLGECVAACDPTVPGWSCGPQRTCRPTPARLEGWVTTGGVCLGSECRSTVDDALCDPDQTCVLAPDGEASFCEPAGLAGEGVACDGVGTGCAPGLLCLDGVCNAVCDAGSPGSCDSGACLGVFASSELNRPGICGVACPGGDADCGAGGVCQPRGASGTVPIGVCAPDPTAVAALGERCAPAPGCAAGLICDRFSADPVCVVACDPRSTGGCGDGETCATTDRVGLGQCAGACDPLAVDPGCVDGQECVQLAPADGLYDPRYAACIAARGLPGLGEPCDGAVGCAGSGVCMDDGSGALVCRVGCDVLGDGAECAAGEVCGFVVTPAPYVLGACLPPANPGSSGDVCAAAGPCGTSGTTCGGGGPEARCLQVCRVDDDCPGGQACTVGAIDWEGRPVDIGLCL